MSNILLSGDGAVLGYCDPSYTPPPPQFNMPAPEGFQDAEFDHLVYRGGVLVVDAAAQFSRAKEIRIAGIKQEAAELIAATDWRLQRAKEREEAGWASLAAVDEILMQREAIRRSSDAAEAQVQALTTTAEVEAFTWEVAEAVSAPHRVTHAAFLDALEALGEEVIPTILAAVESNPALKKWWTYFDKAQVISASDPRLESGLTGLEIAGVLPAGGAQSVIAALTSSPSGVMN